MASRALLLLRLPRRRPPYANAIRCSDVASKISSFLPSSFPSYPCSRSFSWWNRSSDSNSLTESAPSQHELLPTAAHNVRSDPATGFANALNPVDKSMSSENEDRSGDWHHHENFIASETKDNSVSDYGSFSEMATVDAFSGSPVDLMIAFMESVHNITGIQWWLTIVGSSIAVRVFLLPLAIIQLKQVVKIVSLLPQMLLPGSERSIKEQYSLFAKKRKELNCPNPIWFVATPILQVPLFLTSIVAVRRMALENYPGFDYGGILWFTNLTVPGQGALGALLPLIVSAMYLANIKLSFKDVKFKNTKIGMLFRYWTWWLEASSVLVFWVGLYLPQAAQMYWVPSNAWNLIQNILLSKLRIRFIQELKRSGVGTSSSNVNSNNSDNYDSLLLAATENIAHQQHVKAIDLLKCAVKENPERPEAYGGLGQAYLSQRQYSEAEECYKLAITKGNTNEILIAAYSGSASALFQQGKLIECIAALKAVRTFDVPENPTVRFCYYRALVMLASALSHQGLKEEALEVLEEAATYDPNVSQYIKELQEQIGKR